MSVWSIRQRITSTELAGFLLYLSGGMFVLYALASVVTTGFGGPGLS